MSEEIDFEIIVKELGEIINDYHNNGEDIDTIKDKIKISLEEKLSITMLSLQQLLAEYTSSNADSCATQFFNIAPFGNYEKLIEGHDNIVSFLKSEASNSSNWKIYGLEINNKGLLKLIFTCLAIDEGENVMGYVFINKLLKIKHYFIHNTDN